MSSPPSQPIRQALDVADVPANAGSWAIKSVPAGTFLAAESVEVVHDEQLLTGVTFTV